MTRGEMILHVVNHTTYHRGFVATERQEDATQRRRLRSAVKQSRLLPVTLVHAALVPAMAISR
jgi:hypothetical protein